MIKMAIIGLGARGAETYGRFALRKDSGILLTAICDKNNERLNRYQKEFNIEEDHCFISADDLLSRDKLSDVLVIASYDREHYAYAMKAMQKGYHLLLEKPVSADAGECIRIREAAKKYHVTVAVCHVMRYTSYYQKLKEIVKSGILGDVVAVEQTEDVAYWHQAHGFVRGNFRNSEITTPMILQKCCHDMDLLVYLTEKKARKITSFGSLKYFTRENAPIGSADRCLDCSVGNCPFNAGEFYLNNFESLPEGERENRWPYIQLNPCPTLENLKEALRDGPYGRCVFKCDNNVVDRQFVNVEFDDGSIGTLTMIGFSACGGRQTHIYGTKGEAYLDEQRRVIEVSEFNREKTVIGFDSLSDDFSGHGGGDNQMMKEFVSVIEGGGKEMNTSIERSVESHLMCFAAEQSRLNGGEVVSMEEFEKSFL